jgi:hypothetical protein
MAFQPPSKLRILDLLCFIFLKHSNTLCIEQWPFLGEVEFFDSSACQYTVVWNAKLIHCSLIL